MSDEGLSLSNSNATSEPNMPKNRYENILPCKNNVKMSQKRLTSFLAKVTVNESSSANCEATSVCPDDQI